MLEQFFDAQNVVDVEQIGNLALGFAALLSEGDQVPSVSGLLSRQWSRKRLFHYFEVLLRQSPLPVMEGIILVARNQLHQLGF